MSLSVSIMKTLVFLALLGAAFAAREPCQYDFTYSEKVGRCYYVSETCMKYEDAQSFCVSKKGNLTSIRDAVENRVVANIAQLHVPKTEKDYWIGGQVADVEPPAYAWVNGDDFEFNRLHNPFDCALRTCVAGLADRNLWVPLNCDECHYFVCETGTFLPTCPTGYTYNEDIDACYKVSSGTGTWADQEIDCVDDGGHLTSIHSQSENDFVLGLAGNVNYFWAGAQSSAATWPTFTWKDGSAFDFTNWGPNQPDNNIHFCMLVIGKADADATAQGKWGDYVCSLELVGVCKVAPIVPAQFRQIPN